MVQVGKVLGLLTGCWWWGNKKSIQSPRTTTTTRATGAFQEANSSLGVFEHDVLFSRRIQPKPLLLEYLVHYVMYVGPVPDVKLDTIDARLQVLNEIERPLPDWGKYQWPDGTPP